MCHLGDPRNHLPPALVVQGVKASLVIATAAAIGAAAAGCGSGSGGHDTRIAIRAVVRAGCSAGTGDGAAVSRLDRRHRAGAPEGGADRRPDIARIAVAPGEYRAGAAWVAGARLVSALVDGHTAHVARNGLVRFSAPAGADTDLRLVVGLRRTECNLPGAAG